MARSVAIELLVWGLSEFREKRSHSQTHSARVAGHTGDRTTESETPKPLGPPEAPNHIGDQTGIGHRNCKARIERSRRQPALRDSHGFYPKVGIAEVGRRSPDIRRHR